MFATIDDLKAYRQQLNERVYRTGFAMKPVFDVARIDARGFNHLRNGHRSATFQSPADYSGDGRPEIVAARTIGGIAAWTWDGDVDDFVLYWETASQFADDLYNWAGPSIHDLDDDGVLALPCGARKPTSAT